MHAGTIQGRIQGEGGGGGGVHEVQLNPHSKLKIFMTIVMPFEKLRVEIIICIPIFYMFIQHILRIS